MIQNVIPLRREAVSYADEREAELNCRAVCAEASLVLLRSALTVVLARIELRTAVAQRHSPGANAAAWTECADMLREAIARAE